MAGALHAPIMAAMSGRGKSSLVTRGLRLAGMLLHLSRGLLTAALLFPFYARARRQAAIRIWSATLLRILGVRLHAHDAPVRARPLMLVANHVSWLDIFVLNAVLPVRFVAKSEIRGWPAVGWLSLKTGTLFIERGRRRDTARVNLLMAEAMLDGDVVAVFPEGTTTDGSQVLRFHSALLQPALIAGAGVQPVALRFARSDGSLCVEAAYDGDKSLWFTLLQILRQPMIDAHLHFLPLLANDAPHRRALADAAQAAIANRLLR
jgi:1-acyl-sn-glycerol-3-phosphate acyltransferase